MFATPDGRTYKWKTDATYGQPAYLVECDGGRRVSGPLVTFHYGAGSGSTGMETETGAKGLERDACEDGAVAPSSSLRVATRLLPVIDQILVSWVIMEKERRSMGMPSSASSSSSPSSSAPSPLTSPFSSSSSVFSPLHSPLGNIPSSLGR